MKLRTLVETCITKSQLLETKGVSATTRAIIREHLVAAMEVFMAGSDSVTDHRALLQREIAISMALIGLTDEDGDGSSILSAEDITVLEALVGVLTLTLLQAGRDGSR